MIGNILRLFLMLTLLGASRSSQNALQIELRVWPRFARAEDKPAGGVTHPDPTRPQIMSIPAGSLRKSNIDLPAKADEAVLRMLSKDPKERFTDVAAAWQALQESFENSSI